MALALLMFSSGGDRIPGGPGNVLIRARGVEGDIINYGRGRCRPQRIISTRRFSRSAPQGRGFAPQPFRARTSTRLSSSIGLDKDHLS